MALKAYSAGEEPKFPAGYDVTKRTTLNFTDVIANNNKYYNLEVQVAKNGEARIFTQYGRVGAPNPAQEYRVCSSQSEAESEADKIIKAKTKKGYQEIKLVKADVGSDVGKSKTDNTSVSIDALKKAGVKVTEEPAAQSKLHPEVQDLVRTWFGVTQEFVELNLDTKKCPLGQLSLDQITKGKDFLEEARKIVHMTKPDKQELNRLTNLYYSNIPHNFGYRRLDADLLRFDDDTKIDKAYDILDVFADAKNVQAVISKKSAVDAQYATLNATLEYVDPSEPTWKWLDTMVHETRAGNHTGLGKIKIHKIFRVTRNMEDKYFIKNAEKIAKECGKWNPSPIYSNLVKKRPDVPAALKDIYEKANVCPGWHGTRRANMIGITTKGLLIRPSGVIHAGSMYGDGIYWAIHSTKSINYCDVGGSYWAQGRNKTAYLFLGDVAFGNQEMAGGSHMYTKRNIAPNHSVWAKSGGRSGLYNDELIIYNPAGPEQQHALRYIIEFETQAR
jgi:poly [ADP-ribose] polymerase 2/3/4